MRLYRTMQGGQPARYCVFLAPSAHLQQFFWVYAPCSSRSPKALDCTGEEDAEPDQAQSFMAQLLNHNICAFVVCSPCRPPQTSSVGDVAINCVALFPQNQDQVVVCNRSSTVFVMTLQGQVSVSNALDGGMWWQW